MTDAQLIRDFENDTLPADSFHHADHVRLAFAYLSQYPALEALDKFATALKRFATARGKPQLFNETITHAYFFLIRERMARVPAREWEELQFTIPTCWFGRMGSSADIIGRRRCNPSLRGQCLFFRIRLRDRVKISAVVSRLSTAAPFNTSSLWNLFFRPSGACQPEPSTHSLRRGLHSVAAPRL
jgi:hypothetical protein